MGWDVKVLLLFLLIFILTADYLKNRRSGSFPPGPRGIPIVGNIFTLDHSRTHESLTQVDLNQHICICSVLYLSYSALICHIFSQLAETHGNVYSLRMGQTWMVVANSFKVVREVLVTHSESVSDRPMIPLHEDIVHGQGECVLHTGKDLFASL